MRMHPAERREPDPGPSHGSSFAALYDGWHNDVARWLRAMGVRDADLDDLVQDVFVTAHRRMDHFDGKNPAGWLYRIAQLTARNHRRLAWIRNVMSFRNGPDPDELHGEDSPALALEDKQRRALLQRLLNSMHESRRATFYLYEVEGYSGEEIAALQGIPVNTVWTRLHKARKEFFEMLRKHNERGDKA